MTLRHTYPGLILCAHCSMASLSCTWRGHVRKTAGLSHERVSHETRLHLSSHGTCQGPFLIK